MTVKCCKRLFSFWLARAESFPNHTPVHDSKCWKNLFSFPLTRGESYPTKHLCMTPNVANVFSHSHLQGGSLTQPKYSAWLQMLQTFIHIPIRKGGVMPNQTLVHDSKCCKCLCVHFMLKTALQQRVYNHSIQIFSSVAKIFGLIYSNEREIKPRQTFFRVQYDVLYWAL